MENQELLEILQKGRKNPVYVDGFSERNNVFEQFATEEDPDIELVYSEYDCSQMYEGYATVIFWRKSKQDFFENYGSHCSCYGLEGQWNPDDKPIVPGELFKRRPDIFSSLNKD